MSRHGYGRGEYRYFAYPLPRLVAALRTGLYPPLAAIANRWNEALGIETRFPAEHAAYLERCRRAGQTRPTPLMLRYGEGDYNRLHQDLYGEHVFPIQATILLSEPDRDFEGGEFVLTEQRPRMQSRAEVAPLAQGDAVLFPVRHRPVRGARGFHRVNLRHGVSRLRAGSRLTLASSSTTPDSPLSRTRAPGLPRTVRPASAAPGSTRRRNTPGGSVETSVESLVKCRIDPLVCRRSG